MRAIQLYTAVCDKHGFRREAGDILHIGESDEADIEPAAARALVKSGGAASHKPVELEADVEVDFSPSLEAAVETPTAEAKKAK